MKRRALLLATALVNFIMLLFIAMVVASVLRVPMPEPLASMFAALKQVRSGHSLLLLVLFVLKVICLGKLLSLSGLAPKNDTTGNT